MPQSPDTSRRRFQLVLIKPSHYDDDGYVIRWWRAMIPSNSLAALYGLALDCASRNVLGPGVTIDVEPIDEMVTRVDIQSIIARFRRNGNFGLVALVGVQSNQYPRALDLAQPLRSAGIQVAIGGFHVSGCISMLDGHAVELDEQKSRHSCCCAWPRAPARTTARCSMARTAYPQRCSSNVNSLW